MIRGGGNWRTGNASAIALLGCVLGGAAQNVTFQSTGPETCTQQLACDKKLRTQCGEQYCSFKGECCYPQQQPDRKHHASHSVPVCCCNHGHSGHDCRGQPNSADTESSENYWHEFMTEHYTYVMFVCTLCCWACCVVRRCRLAARQRQSLRESLLQSLLQATEARVAAAAPANAGLTTAELRALRPVKCVVSELSDEEDFPGEQDLEAQVSSVEEQVEGQEEEEQQDEETVSFRAITGSSAEAAEEYLWDLAGGDLELAVNIYFERGGTVTATAASSSAERREWMSKGAAGRMSMATASAGCVICLEPFEEGEDLLVLPLCGHAYHQSCATDWLKSHDTCPTCRVRLLASFHRTQLLVPLPFRRCPPRGRKCL